MGTFNILMMNRNKGPISTGGKILVIILSAIAGVFVSVKIHTFKEDPTNNGKVEIIKVFGNLFILYVIVAFIVLLAAGIFYTLYEAIADGMFDLWNILIALLMLSALIRSFKKK